MITQKIVKGRSEAISEAGAGTPPSSQCSVSEASLTCSAVRPEPAGLLRWEALLLYERCRHRRLHPDQDRGHSKWGEPFSFCLILILNVDFLKVPQLVVSPWGMMLRKSCPCRLRQLVRSTVCTEIAPGERLALGTQTPVLQVPRWSIDARVFPTWEGQRRRILVYGQLEMFFGFHFPYVKNCMKDPHRLILLGIKFPEI